MKIEVTIKGFTGTGGSGSGDRIDLPEGSNVWDLLDALVEKYGDPFYQKIYREESGELKRNRRFLINGRDIVFLDGMETELQDGDQFAVITQLSGGSKPSGYK